MTNSSGAVVGDVVTGPAGGFASGQYVMNNLPPGRYTVAFVAGPPSYMLIGPTTRTSANLSAGQSDLTLSFPFINPTAVTVVDLIAWQQADGRVDVVWRTVGGSAAPQFDVWRASASDGEFARLTTQPLDGQPDGNGYLYAWSDATAVPGTSYWYQLQEAPTGPFIGPAPLTPVQHRMFLPWAARR